MQASYLNGFYEETEYFMTGVLERAFKTNSSLFRGVLTGVLKMIKIRKIFSDMSNATTYSVIDDKYAEYFGFTEEEMKTFLKQYRFSVPESTKENYGGYNFGGKEIYNPWSIVNYMGRGGFNYVSCSDDLIKYLYVKTNSDNKKKIEQFILGKSMEFEYNDQITYQDLDDYDNLNMILNVMFYYGYLTLDKKDTKETMYVKMTNYGTKEFLTDLKNAKMNALNDIVAI